MKKIKWIMAAGGLFLGGCGGEIGTPAEDFTGMWSQTIIAREQAGLDTSANGYVVLQDFDNDGKTDAASGFGSSEAVVVHMQDNPGTWNSFAVGENLGPINSLATDDIDDSGQPDVVAATGRERIWILFAPTFAGPVTQEWRRSALANPVAVNSWNDVKIGHFDDRSEFNIVGTSSESEIIVLWQSRGRVTSAATYEPFVIASNLSGGFERLAAADVDQDGDQDLVAVGVDGGLIWLENLGPANITSPWTLHRISNEQGFTRLLVVDVDQDEDLDVVVTDRAQGQVQWFENVGSPRQDPVWPEYLMADLSPGLPDALGSGDLDDDGDLDILAGTDTHDQAIYWLERQGTGQSLWRKRLVARVGADVGELPVGDINGLGLPDFATTLAGSAQPVDWYNQQ